MADKMTLQQARDHVFIVINSSHLPGWEKNREAWKVLDAHIAAMGEPVAFVAGDDVERHMDWNPKIPVFPIPIGTPLYRAAPPASGDWDKVQEIISKMRSGLQLPGENCSTAYVREWADKLTAALPEQQP